MSCKIIACLINRGPISSGGIEDKVLAQGSHWRGILGDGTLADVSKKTMSRMSWKRRQQGAEEVSFLSIVT